MGASGAVNIVMRQELNEAADQEERLQELVADYEHKFQNPYKAAEMGYIDEVLLPEDLRPRICQALLTFQNKRDDMPPKKHGNIPL